MIEDLMLEHDLVVTVGLVRSGENKADALTRVPRAWLGTQHAMVVTDGRDMLRELHEVHHLGVNKTWYLTKKCYPDMTVDRDVIKTIVETCGKCRSIDPAPVQWSKGELEVEEVWDRVACDVTHYAGAKYLTMVDCGPSRFAVWRKIPDETDVRIVEQLDQIFRERGPPRQLLLDNSATFRSDAVKRLCCSKWKVEVVFRCAYRPSGNGIVERNHRTIKRMAARSGRDILDMVYWYNLSPRSGTNEELIPSQLVFNYEWKTPVLLQSVPEEVNNEAKFPIGKQVFVKPPGAKCTTQWPRGMVTGAGSTEVSVEVDGIPRHVADIREVVGEDSRELTTAEEGDVAEDGNGMGSALRRSERVRQQPVYFNDYIL